MTSAAQFGALPLPAPAPGAEDSAGDPGLDVLLAFAKAVLVQACGTAWATIAPGAAEVVKITKAHDPGATTFNTAWCPALFGWRTGGEIETLADDYEIETAKLTLLWVFLPTTNEKQRLRSPAVNAIAKALEAAIKRGRHPAWVQGGDSDPQASKRGSFLWEWAGWFAFDKASWKLQELIVESESTKASYPGVQFELTVRERVFLGQSTDPLKAALTVHLPDEEDNPLVSLELT